MIGVYGGIFNPVHFGHLRAALEINEMLGLTELLFVPCGKPPHKSIPGNLPKHRLRMLEIAVNGAPGFKVDSRELTGKGFSYTVDTLTSVKRDYDGQPLCLVLGLDSFASLATWNRWRQLFDLSHIVVMIRPGSAIQFDEPLRSQVVKRQIDDPEAFKQSQNGLICFKQVTQLDISSTRIREMIQQGKSARYLLPKRVWAMIKKENLYRQQNEGRS